MKHFAKISKINITLHHIHQQHYDDDRIRKLPKAIICLPLKRPIYILYTTSRVAARRNGHLARSLFRCAAQRAKPATTFTFTAAAATTTTSVVDSTLPCSRVRVYGWVDGWDCGWLERCYKRKVMEVMGRDAISRVRDQVKDDKIELERKNILIYPVRKYRIYKIS